MRTATLSQLHLSRRCWIERVRSTASACTTDCEVNARPMAPRSTALAGAQLAARQLNHELIGEPARAPMRLQYRAIKLAHAPCASAPLKLDRESRYESLICDAGEALWLGLRTGDSLWFCACKSGELLPRHYYSPSRSIVTVNKILGIRDPRSLSCEHAN